MSARVGPKAYGIISVSTQKAAKSAISAADVKKAGDILKKGVENHNFEDGGIPSLVGKYTLTKTSKPGVYEVTGKIKDDCQWGGASEGKFKATIDINKGTMTNFKTWDMEGVD